MTGGGGKRARRADPLADTATLRARVATALAQRLPRLPPETDAFRWVDEEIPAVTVDLFRDVAVLSLYRGCSGEEERALAQALAGARDLRAVYVKRRPKEARRVANEAAAEVAPVTPLWGEAVESLTVKEGGRAFEVRPSNGLSVGLYLDSRDPRQWIERHVRGKAVLNLFAYTCGFGVAALRGGAARAVNVDASRKVLEWGEANHALNGLAVERRDFVSGDAFEWLGRFAKKGEQFGVVIVDPPGFATVDGRRFTAARQYDALVDAAQRVVEPGGTLFAMCNVEAMSDVELDRHVKKGLGSRPHHELTRFGASAVDFRQPSTLKVRALRLG